MENLKELLPIDHDVISEATVKLEPEVQTMLNRLREMVANKNIEIIYLKLPEGLSSVYTEMEDIKFILIHNKIKDTELEGEGIAFTLGSITAMKELGLKKVNNLDSDNIEAKLVNKLAKIYQEEILKGMMAVRARSL